MEDIVKRLRNVSKVELHEPLCMEAADEIERLRKKSEEDEELRAKAVERIEELHLQNDRLRATIKMITSDSY